MIDTERNENGNSISPNNLGRVDGENIFFTPDEISYLTKKYILLYKNRQDKFAFNLKNHHYTQSVKREKLGKKYSYKPNVSK